MLDAPVYARILNRRTPRITAWTAAGALAVAKGKLPNAEGPDPKYTDIGENGKRVKGLGMAQFVQNLER